MKTSRVGVIVVALVAFWLSGWTIQAAQPGDSAPPPVEKSKESPPSKPKPERASKPERGLRSPQVLADGHITFRLMAPKAEKVSLVCDTLRPQPLSKDEDSGVWSLTVGPVPPGIYEYQFEVDGVKIADPANPNVFGNRQGPRQFVEVPGPAGHPRPDEWRDVPHGTVAIHWYTSKATDARRRVHVYTPPGYEQETGKHYPVLYLLHGSGDNDSHWMLLGRANVIADTLIADKQAVPMIIVMPDGHVADPARERESGNRNLGRQLFQKDLLESVLPLVEADYRVLPDAQHRGIIGLSMGGGQSISVGLTHMDQFAWVGALSAAVSGNDPALAALRSDPNAANQKLKCLWLAIGKNDFLLKRNKEFIKTLDELKIHYTYQEPDGGHTWSFWRARLTEFLPLLFR
jgi:enterochelin esterase family protein